MTADARSGTYWLYTNVALFELVVKDEDRDVWSVYLKQNDYDLALKYAKVCIFILAPLHHMIETIPAI